MPTVEQNTETNQISMVVQSKVLRRRFDEYRINKHTRVGITIDATKAKTHRNVCVLANSADM